MHDALEQYKVHSIQELKKQDRRDEANKLLHDVARQVQPILRKRQWTVPRLREFFPTNPNLLVRINAVQGVCQLRVVSLGCENLTEIQSDSTSIPALQQAPAALAYPVLAVKAPRVQGLNVNGHGGTTSEIRVRLRPHHSPNSFYPYEDILGTMLHEITHNVRGPHDAQFYKVLDEVTKECEDFMARGITGTGSGFDGPSCGRLGSHGAIPSHNMPEAAMKAAQIKCALSCLQPIVPVCARQLRAKS